MNHDTASVTTVPDCVGVWTVVSIVMAQAVTVSFRISVMVSKDIYRYLSV